MKNKKSKIILRKWWFWGLVIVLIIITISVAILIRKNTFSNSDKNKTSNTSSCNIIADNDDKYFIKNFNKIKMGITYNQVKVILGDGKIETPSVDDRIVAYSWSNKNGSIIIVGIQADKVVLKTQVVVKFINAKVTLKKYNKINNGMTYNKVKGILGEGQLESQSKIDGSKTEEYEWVNSDYTNIEITFLNNKVVTKSQRDLK